MYFYPFPQNPMMNDPMMNVPLPIPHPLLNAPYVAPSFANFSPSLNAVPPVSLSIPQPELESNVRKIYLQNQKQVYSQIKSNISEYAKSLDETIAAITKEIAKIEKEKPTK